jgi:hypothetical protein
MLVCVAHGFADWQLLRGFLVTCVIGWAGDCLQGTPPCALNLREKWRRSCRKRRHFSVRGDDKNWMRICQSANPWRRLSYITVNTHLHSM